MTAPSDAPNITTQVAQRLGQQELDIMTMSAELDRRDATITRLEHRISELEKPVDPAAYPAP